MSLVQGLRAALPPGLGLGSADPRAPARGIWPAEEAATARMIPARLREFAAGRRAARAAMAALGLPAAALPMGPDRAPLWPAPVIGSIAHDGTVCLALVGRRADWAGIGLALEPDLPLPGDLMTTICHPGEAADARAARAVFCAKEAAYKALHPQLGRPLAFHDMTVHVGPGCGFAAVLGPDCTPLAAGTRIEGRLFRGAGRLGALVLIRPL